MTARARQLTQVHPGSIPVRTCVGCRERAAKSSLLRLVTSGDDVIPDPQARMPGRGAYLHPSMECLELARRRRAFPRALRATGPLAVNVLASYISMSETGRTKQTCIESRSRSL
jgi:uncharacterized protein